MTRTFDPFDAEAVQAAWPLLEELRRDAPLAPIGEGMQYVTRHAECRRVLRDTTSFSNASGFKAPGVVVPAEDRILGEMDPPQHTAVRRVMITALTPQVVRSAEEFVRRTATTLLSELAVPGRADLVPAYTVPLPNRVTVHLLGLPAEDADSLAAWAKELMESGFPATNRSGRGEGFALAFPEFADYIDDKISERAAELEAGRNEHPTEVLTRLLEVKVGDEHLSRRQLRALVRNLITGGLTTTSQLLGNLIHQLLTDPDLEHAVRNDGRLLTVAIEESLRLRPPVMFVLRGCVQDTVIDGLPVRAGERLVVGTASANRDERVFIDADQYRLDRENADEHLTFGHGPHVCPGANLARTVARIGIEVLLDRFPPGTIRAAPDHNYENVATFFECGPRHLRVEMP
ncbi:MAG: cytochrome P450 [Acidimicrobiales bacterium]